MHPISSRLTRRLLRLVHTRHAHERTSRAHHPPICIRLSRCRRRPPPAARCEPRSAAHRRRPRRPLTDRISRRPPPRRSVAWSASSCATSRVTPAYTRYRSRSSPPVSGRGQTRAPDEGGRISRHRARRCESALISHVSAHLACIVSSIIASSQ
jgi:hypothetical protein